MQKNWGYAVITCATLGAIATAITLFTENSMLSEILSIFTIAMCITSIGSVAVAIKQSQSMRAANKIQSKETKHPVRRQSDLISNIEEDVITTEDALVYEESAESAKATSTLTHRDDESGLLSHSFFPVYLEQRITAARRTLRPVSLVIFELDGLDRNDSGSPSDRNFFVSAVGDVVKRTLRESDCAFRIDENTFAAVMDDTTESGAVWAAERVRGVLHTGALAGRVTVSAGVACYPSHALECEDLIECANGALDVARSRGVDQVEIAAEQAQ